MSGRVSNARREALLPVVVAAWNREDRPSVAAIAREIPDTDVGPGLVRSLLRSAGIEPKIRIPRTAQHGDPGMWHTRRCRCDVCVEAMREYRRAEARRNPMPPERLESGLAGIKARARQAQAESLKSATRNGSRWTGPEMELVAREDLTVTQVAAMTGRTYNAVSNARQALRSPAHRDHARMMRALHGDL